MPDVQNAVGKYRVGKMFAAALGNFKGAAGGEFFVGEVKKAYVAVVAVNDEFIVGKNGLSVGCSYFFGNGSGSQVECIQVFVFGGGVQLVVY